MGGSQAKLAGILADPTLALMGHSLDRLSKTQQVIGHNIANVDTPQYRAQTLSFEASLENALGTSQRLTLARTHAGHVEPDAPLLLEPHIVDRDNPNARIDGNTVDINQEMLELVETGLKYRAVAQLASKRLALLKTIAIES
jgi:flagellar basal-body rod protein FlgB